MVRDRDGRPQGPPGGALLLCVRIAAMRCWESPWGKQIDGTYAIFCLHVLSIYPKIFLRVFIVYRLLVGFLFVLCILLYVQCSCVLVTCFG